MEIKNTEPKKEVVDSQGARNAPKQEHTDTLNPRWASLRKIGLRTVQVVLVVFGLLVIIRIPVVLEREETAKVVAKIHATKLTMDDVMGKNLPPDPGVDADKTIAGVDANKNGIRDDVELAIFKEYATSSKTRAVLLQYALALQMEFTQPLVNTETVIAVAQEESRAHYCVTNLSKRDDLKRFMNETGVYFKFVESRQINTSERDNYQKDFFSHLRSYGDISYDCDLDINAIPD